MAYCIKSQGLWTERSVYWYIRSPVYWTSGEGKILMGIGLVCVNSVGHWLFRGFFIFLWKLLLLRNRLHGYQMEYCCRYRWDVCLYSKCFTSPLAAVLVHSYSCILLPVHSGVDNIQPSRNSVWSPPLRTYHWKKPCQPTLKQITCLLSLTFFCMEVFKITSSMEQGFSFFSYRFFFYILKY